MRTTPNPTVTIRVTQEARRRIDAYRASIGKRRDAEAVDHLLDTHPTTKRKAGAK